VARERVLVNFFYAPQVGHAIEALHYCLGHHAADPEREVSVALNAATPVVLAEWCPFVSHAYAIDHPFVDAGAAPALDGVPRDWDWVLDDARRHQDIQLELFAGMGQYYAASDAHLVAARGRSVAGAARAGYVPHQQLRLQLPASVELDGGPWIAVMPRGSGEPPLYPSAASWHSILDSLRAAIPGVRFALVGRVRQGRDDAASLREAADLDLFEADLADQLATVEACDVFLAPHTGFGMAALAVGTPWLAISGGRWFEWFFNRVPFRSVIPDTARWPSFSQFDPLAVADDGEDGPRIPSMSRARIREDLDAIAAAAVELVEGRVDYEQALADYFRDLLRAHRGEPSAIWSIDGIHVPYVAQATRSSGGLRNTSPRGDVG
jgi:hypothetical protein